MTTASLRRPIYGPYGRKITSHAFASRSLSHFREGFPSVAENLQLAARLGGISIAEVFKLFRHLQTRLKAKAEKLSGKEHRWSPSLALLLCPAS